MKGAVFAILAILATIQAVDSNSMNFLLGRQTIRESILQGSEMFNNLLFDIVEDGLQKNPKAYEMLKGPFQEIKKNMMTNMKAIHTFAIDTTLWAMKNSAEYAQTVWMRHGKAILDGSYDHEKVFHIIMKGFQASEEFITVKGLGLKSKFRNNLDK